MSVETVDVGAPAPANEGAVVAAIDTGNAGAAPAADAKSAPLSVEQQDERETADLMKVWQKHNPDRYSDGKFAPKEAPADQAAPATEADAAIKTEVSADPPKDAKVEQASKPAIDLPLSWSAEQKAIWATLPPDAQAYIAKRDKETHDAITQSGQKLKTLSEQVKAYEPFEKLIAANSSLFQKLGTSPDGAFQEAINLYASMERDTIGTLVHLAARKGIDLRPALQGMPAQQVQQPQPDPQITQLLERDRRREAELTELKQWRTERETAEKQATIRQGESIVEQVQNEKDKGGNLLRPYFNDPEVQDYICTAVQYGKIAENPDRKAKLEAAYDQATRALPHVYQRIQEDQRKADEAKRTAEAKAKADEARKSNSVNVRSAPAAANPKTEDDVLHEIAAKHWPGYRKSA